MLALPRLLAIPSTSLVAVVHAALHPPPTPTGAAPPSLNAVLEAYLCAPCAAPLHRRAIHTGLNGTSDATRVLGVFADWLEAFRERGETDSGWGMDTVTNGWGEDDRRAPVAPVVAVGKDVPLASVSDTRETCADSLLIGLFQLIQHTQLFLDAHLPSLLSYAPAHDLIERLHATLQPLLVSQSALLAARGTIEAFVKLARREEKQARAGKKGKTSGGAPGGTLYSVEEIQL